MGRGSVHRRSTALSAAGARARGRAGAAAGPCPVRGGLRGGGGGRVGGARREVRSPWDRHRHRCAPSSHGLGEGWRPGHRAQLHTTPHPKIQAFKAFGGFLGPRGEGCSPHSAASWGCFQAQVKPRLEVVLTALPGGGSSGVGGFLSSSSPGATVFLLPWRAYGRVPCPCRIPSWGGRARWRELCPPRSRQPSINALFSVIRPLHPSLDHFIGGSFE